MKISTVKTQEDGSYLVNDSLTAPLGNARGMRKIQAWIDAGNTPTPYVGPTALELWEQQMASNDNVLPRWAEDLYDVLTQSQKDAMSNDPKATKVKVADKKALRATKPE